MCTLKVLNKTTNGILLFCPRNKVFNLSFNNLTFNFDSKQLYAFIEFLEDIDCDYWENEYRNSIYEKRIPIPTSQKNFIILMDKNDLQELKYLLDFDTEKQLLSYNEINYKLIFN